MVMCLRGGGRPRYFYNFQKNYKMNNTWEIPYINLTTGEIILLCYNKLPGYTLSSNIPYNQRVNVGDCGPNLCV